MADLGEPEDPGTQCRWNKEILNFSTSKQGAQEVNTLGRLVMGREWFEMALERNSMCRLCTCELQFEMVIFLRIVMWVKQGG